MTAQDVLVIRGAEKRFGNVQALAGADLDVRSGEILAVLGPNGAGKSTLVKAVAGRVLLDQGTITLFGEIVEPRAIRHGLGLVPQEIAIYPKLTARENLVAFGRFHGLEAQKAKSQADWALDWTGLSERADSATSTFSGGMKRRLNIACGVLHAPRLLILDEPTVAVDPQSRDKIYDMLNMLRQGGTTIMLTTHHLEEAEARCDRIAIIDKGKTIASGTVGELVARTVGTARQVTVKTRGDVTTPPLGFSIGPHARTLETKVADVASEIGPALQRLVAAGIEVADVDVRGLGLHAAFIHLTGSELRE